MSRINYSVLLLLGFLGLLAPDPTLAETQTPAISSATSSQSEAAAESVAVANAEVAAEIERSALPIVKILCRSRAVPLDTPWRSSFLRNVYGTGSVLADHTVLTNAHVIEDAAEIRLQVPGQPPVPTSLIAVSHDLDLALLRPSEPLGVEGGFELGRIPPLDAPLQLVGFPSDAQTPRTRTTTSRGVEMKIYQHAWERRLLLEVAAASDPGESGGAVTHDGKLIGLLSQNSRASGAGFAIPGAVLGQFLADVADSKVDGVPTFGIDVQPISHPHQRRRLGMRDDETGALVTRVHGGSTAEGFLQSGDVLLSIDGHAILQDLSVSWEDLGRVHFSHPIRIKQVGDLSTLNILRDGERTVHSVPVARTARLVPGRLDHPSYRVYAGLVFQPLTLRYLSRLQGAATHLRFHALHRNVSTPDRAQIVVLTSVLPAEINRGYEGLTYSIISQINGIPVRDLAHLSSLLDEIDSDWVEFQTEGGLRMTLKVSEVARANRALEFAYGIGRDRSPDLPDSPDTGNDAPLELPLSR